MVVVDSGVWIDFFNGSANPARDALRGLLGQGDIEVCVPDLVLFEVLRGFRDERHFRQARRLMSAFTVPRAGGEELVTVAAGHYRALRSEGITIRNALDVLIATFCIENDHHLLHRDRDFAVFETKRGLKVWKH